MVSTGSCDLHYSLSALLDLDCLSPQVFSASEERFPVPLVFAGQVVFGFPAFFCWPRPDSARRQVHHFGEQAVMPQMWISKEEYDENGPLIVHRKTF